MKFDKQTKEEYAKRKKTTKKIKLEETDKEDKRSTNKLTKIEKSKENSKKVVRLKFNFFNRGKVNKALQRGENQKTETLERKEIVRMTTKLKGKIIKNEEATEEGSITLKEKGLTKEEGEYNNILILSQ